MTKPTILIVDDEPHILLSLLSVLEDHFNVLTAHDGRHGLSIFKTKSLSLILVDLQMPEMNGVELIENIRKEHSNVPILVMTGNSRHEWAVRCADSNVQGYISKPVEVKKLIGRINTLLGIDEFEVLKKQWKQDYESKEVLLSHSVRSAIKYIHSHHKNMTRDELAQYLNFCPEHLSRKFSAECGIHLTEYINIVRIEKSKEFLKHTNKKICFIASEVGIHDVGYFCKLFKKHCGVTPDEFRNQS